MSVYLLVCMGMLDDVSMIRIYCESAVNLNALLCST